MDQELLGKLLIASPGLEDIRFQNSVILICEHSKDATMGLILNKPLYNFDTSQFLKKMKINSMFKNQQFIFLIAVVAHLIFPSSTSMKGFLRSYQPQVILILVAKISIIDL